MIFEYDQKKSSLNLTKHNIDFENAKKIWNDVNIVEVPICDHEEKRWLCIGKLNEKFWSAVITCRGENIRIISVRRSRQEEIEIYEEE